ncbi:MULTISPECIES: glycosyltransferase [Bacteroidaceae]|uniref:Glycosyltransferase involved in cell wall bisynthesis n=1 Tax=Bacteroides ovatus TaxID=28116 RepID=A0A1G6G0E0_BACOV|nr:glycosyltransferase [Bacteroides ovatus]SDB75371.1 Glycosyltransferase involved in cell wall bisynthesis [Bacteroides ovatus]
MNISILQPEVPHYRISFFQQLKQLLKGEENVYVYNSLKSSKKQGFNVDVSDISYIPNIKRGGFLIYNPFYLLNSKTDVLVLMFHFAHFTTWLLLLTKWLHRKKIILWGQGISVKRYLDEEHKPNLLMKWQLSLADGAWIYMPKEKEQWQRIFPKKPLAALGNTIAGAVDMVNYQPSYTKEELKQKYGIMQDIIFIYCARFNTPLRRIDIWERVINELDAHKYGFIVIGDGESKPDLKKYANVYDYGLLYDDSVKRELFAVADVYFQVAWMGLSIVEAMAYGKPVFTFKRTEEIKQGVEYDYIRHGETGLLFNDYSDCINQINSINKQYISEMGSKARELIRISATPSSMANNAYSLLEKII